MAKKYERKTPRKSTSKPQETAKKAPEKAQEEINHIPDTTKKVDRRGAPPGHKGNPPHIPTDENRKIVKALTAYGVPQEDIARQLQISADTLARHYRRELDTAAVEANARMAETLFQAGLKGDVRAMMFWLKTRAKWSETHKLEHTGKDGGAIETRMLPATDQWIEEHFGDGAEAPPPVSGED